MHLYAQCFLATADHVCGLILICTQTCALVAAGAVIAGGTTMTEILTGISGAVAADQERDAGE